MLKTGLALSTKHSITLIIFSLIAGGVIMVGASPEGSKIAGASPEGSRVAGASPEGSRIAGASPSD